MFWLAILTRDTGIPASKRLGIKDEVAAFEFDLAVSFRLFRLRIEEEKNAARRIAYEVSKIFNGDTCDDSDDILNSPYVDKDTEIW